MKVKKTMETTTKKMMMKSFPMLMKKCTFSFKKNSSKREARVFSFMTLKMKAEPGLEFDDVIEAMDSRAVEENLKKTGHNMVWKEVEAKTGESTPRFEILQYCDALVARMVLDYSPEFSIFLPCRISVLEDAVGDVWLMTLDWDVSWLALTWHPDSQIDDELKENGRRIRNALVSIMEAGASGEW